MFSVGLICFTWLLLLEYRIIAAARYFIGNLFSPKIVPIVGISTDSDVIEEQQRIKTMSSMESDSLSLVVKDMSKVYGSFLAVNQLSIGVDS